MKKLIILSIFFVLSLNAKSKDEISQKDEVKNTEKIIKCINLKDGDIPVKIMGHALDKANMETILKEISKSNKMAKNKKSASLDLSVIRGGEEKKISVKLSKDCQI